MPQKTKKKKEQPVNGHSRRKPTNGRKMLTTVEQTLLGVAPGDLFPVGMERERAISIPELRLTRLETIRSFLDRQPEIRDALAVEIEQTWKDCGERREDFLAAFAGRRAEIISRAELSRTQPQVAQVVRDFHSELDRYLSEIGGLGSESSPG